MAALTVWGNGVGVYGADWANGLVQGGAFLADLQSFVGVPGVTVYTIGYAAVGDGGQGSWTWNAGITGGDNVSTVLPNGSIQGGWQRVSYDYSGMRNWQLVVPQNGFSITPLSSPPVSLLILNPSGMLTSGTIVFPSGNPGGFVFTIASSQAISALALVGPINNPLTSIAAGGFASWAQIEGTWFRIG